MNVVEIELSSLRIDDVERDPKYHIIIFKDIEHETYLPIFADEHRIKLFKFYLASSENINTYPHGKFITFVPMLKLSGIQSSKIIITDLVDGVFKAVIIFQQGKKENAIRFTFQCTVTEAMLIGFHFSTRYFVSANVMQRSAVVREDIDLKTGETSLPDIDLATLYSPEKGFEMKLPETSSKIAIILHLLLHKLNSS